MMNDRKMMFRDPLRFAMTAKLCKKGTIALFALLMAVYGVILLKLCGGMQGVRVIAASGVLGCALLTGFAWYAMRDREEPVIVLLCAAG